MGRERMMEYRRAVLGNAGLLLLLYGGAIGLACQAVWSERHTLMGFVLAFAAAQAMFVGGISSVLVGIKILRRIRVRRLLRLQPRIQEWLWPPRGIRSRQRARCTPWRGGIAARWRNVCWTWRR
jgi:hypothetical protein